MMNIIKIIQLMLKDIKLNGIYNNLNMIIQ